MSSPGPGGMARLFFAVVPDRPRASASQQPRVRWRSAPTHAWCRENYHVTLAFVGEIPPRRSSRPCANSAPRSARARSRCIWIPSTSGPSAAVRGGGRTAIPCALRRYGADCTATCAAASWALEYRRRCDRMSPWRGRCRKRLCCKRCLRLSGRRTIQPDALRYERRSAARIQ